MCGAWLKYKKATTRRSDHAPTSEPRAPRPRRASTCRRRRTIGTPVGPRSSEGQGGIGARRTAPLGYGLGATAGRSVCESEPPRQPGTIMQVRFSGNSLAIDLGSVPFRGACLLGEAEEATLALSELDSAAMSARYSAAESEVDSARDSARDSAASSEAAAPHGRRAP